MTVPRLSKYFTLGELIASQTAARRGLDNTPPPELLNTLAHTAQQLDVVRELLEHPIIVSSGYRSPEVNRAVGSTANPSAHTLGYAVDFICPGFGDTTDVFDVVRGTGIKFDQLILECPRSNGGWVHISFDPRYRQQALFSEDGRHYRLV